MTPKQGRDEENLREKHIDEFRNGARYQQMIKADSGIIEWRCSETRRLLDTVKGQAEIRAMLERDLAFYEGMREASQTGQILERTKNE